MAAMRLVLLKYVNIDNAYRRQIASWSNRSVVDSGQIWTVSIPEGCESWLHLYRINSKYWMYGEQRGACPRATEASATLISLPIHMRLSYNDVSRVVTTLRSLV